MTDWIWGKLYALDHKSGQYVVEVSDVEKIIEKYHIVRAHTMSKSIQCYTQF